MEYGQFWFFLNRESQKEEQDIDYFFDTSPCYKVGENLPQLSRKRFLSRHSFFKILEFPHYLITLDYIRLYFYQFSTVFLFEHC